MIALSREELRALLAAARAHSERDWLMILVACLHGLRASEVIAIKGDDLRDGHLTVQRLKGSNRTTQQLVEDADPLLSERGPLLEFAGRVHGDHRVFAISRATFWRLIRKHGATAGLPAHKCHPHVLKHTIAMISIKSAGIENVRQWLGHKSMSSTGEYLKVNDEQAGISIRAALSSS